MSNYLTKDFTPTSSAIVVTPYNAESFIEGTDRQWQYRFKACKLLNNKRERSIFMKAIILEANEQPVQFVDYHGTARHILEWIETERLTWALSTQDKQWLENR